jgi:gliding motility-associated-like protein
MMNGQETYSELKLLEQPAVLKQLVFLLLCFIACPLSSVGQYTITQCQSQTDALVGPDRNDWSHANLAVVNEAYLHNFEPIDLPCGFENASLMAVEISITLESNSGIIGCNNIPVFGNVMLNCPLTTSSICPIVQDVLSPGCAFGSGQTAMGTYSLSLNSCGVFPQVSDIIGVDIVPATELLGSCPNIDNAISNGNVALVYEICITYTLNQDLPDSCDETISQSCDDADPCTGNDMQMVSVCDNTIVCQPCMGEPVSDCSTTIDLPCDDGNSCTVDDMERVSSCDISLVCIPCQGTAVIQCTSTMSLPCDDGDTCTENDEEIVDSCDNSIICAPCAGVLTGSCIETELLPCDDGNSCTINDVQTVSLCDNTFVCEPCMGEIMGDCSVTINLPCDDGDPCTALDVVTVSACDETITCVPCEGIPAESCSNTLSVACDDGDECTQDDVEWVDACDTSVICIPCQGSVISPQLCDDGDCDNGVELWDENTCTCITVVSIVGCTDELSCNYNALANCNEGCDYNCIDCLGEPNGEAIVDECGECLLPDDPLRDISCLDLLYVPNAFTPDGDGVNDYFSVRTARDMAYFEIRIFDRIGQEVFFSNDVDFRWSGNIDGGGYFGQSEIYAYKIQYSFELARVIQKTGMVSLFR